MNKVTQKVNEYLSKGLKVIPLTKNNDGKGCIVKGWQTKIFTADNFTENHNVGINIGLSNLVDIDLDSKNAEIFGSKFLNPNTMIFGVKPHKGLILKTHFLYKNSNNLKYLKREYPDKSTIAELRVEGNTVCPPSIAKSKLCKNDWVERVSIREDGPIATDQDLLKKFNKLCAASALRYLLEKRNSNNIPFVKLASCLLKYTDWDQKERWWFVEAIVSTLPKFNWRDIEYKLKSIENNHSKENTKSSGYKAFAEEVSVSSSYAKDLFSWIGKVNSDEEKKDTKKIVDFFSNRMLGYEFKMEIKREFLINPIIPKEGLGILAGRPKSMKSFLTLDLAYSVQNQESNFLNQGLIDHGDVLLLALEDNKDSMALRIQGMKYADKIHPTTFVDFNCPLLTQGLEESLSEWCSKVSNPRFVIIDTFQKIKPLSGQGQGKANAYEIDYYYLGKLKDLAHKHKLFILYVHHLKQASMDYSWDRIMGSTGHQGVPDAMYMLDRDEVGNRATLKGRGRNFKDFSFDLEWNSQELKYSYSGDSYVIKTEFHKKKIYLAMKSLAEDNRHSVKPKDVCSTLNLVTQKEKSNISKNMQRMKDKSELNQGEKYGEYKLACDLSQIDKDGNLIPKKVPF
ncbi:AAA family ATPase [Candidatus Pelagibacter sp. HIMB1611]|uniref:AAA family ATPase n=1 Tax=Candidatus Pelagibacter sp. HIMB1611 TaxID=3413357 RepID=UPI003F879794